MALDCFSQGIQAGDSSGDCLFYRSRVYLALRKYSLALVDLNAYIVQGFFTYRMLALSHLLFVKNELGVESHALLSEATKLIEQHSHSAELYFRRSSLYCRYGQYELASADIYKAIELAPQIGANYVQLAIIKFCLGDKLEFYRNFDEALRKGYDIDYILIFSDYAKAIYKQVLDDSEFIRILDKYDQSWFIDEMKKEAHELTTNK
jgi:tetratricopeptide (TPR) repeat protein